MQMMRWQFDEKLRELNGLKKRYRDSSRGLAHAAEHGGSSLSKIPEYASLTETLELLAGQIARLEDELQGTVIVDPSALPLDRVTIMSVVTVENLLSGEVTRYVFEPNGTDGIQAVTQASPIGQAILGQAVDTIVEVRSGSAFKLLHIRAIDQAVSPKPKEEAP